MEKGLAFALLAAVSYAASVVFVRKGVSQAGESFTATVIGVFIGVPFFAASVSLSGDWDKLWSVSGQGFILLAIAGIIHFVAGRLLVYHAYRVIGANKSSAFIRTSPFYTLIYGVFLLNEVITILLVLGVLCIFAGAVLVGTERRGVNEEKQKGFSRSEVKGILTALGGALCFGTSPALIRPVVAEIGSPSVAALISYVAASIIMACVLLPRQYRQQMFQPKFFAALIPIVIGGVFVAVAQLFNYTALRYSPASWVTPLIGTSVLFVFLFSFFLNRKIEVFTLKVLLGMAATVVGAFLIFY